MKDNSARTAPGPKGKPLLGVAPDLKRDVLGTLLAAWREFGDVVRLRSPVPNVPEFLVVHPDGVQHILSERADNYHHAPMQRRRLGQVIGNALVVSEDERARERRRQLLPGFQPERIARFVPELTVAIGATLDRWADAAERRQPLELRAEMVRVAHDLITRALFGSGGSEPTDRPMAELLEFAFAGMMNPVTIPEWVPTGSNRRFVRARAQMDDYVYRAIGELRRTEGDGSLLASFLGLDTDEVVTDRQARDEAIASIFVGRETVSNALTWSWYLLSLHPAAVDELEAEVDSVLAGRTPTADDLPGLQYTRRVLQEALRLDPPLWMTARYSLADDEVDGYRIPADSVVVVSQYLTHRHPDFWPNPEEFDPRRHTEGQAKARHPYAYFPFGAGARRCVGYPFAMAELVLVVAMVAQRYRLELVPGHRVEPDPGPVLRTRPAVPVTVRAR